MMWHTNLLFLFAVVGGLELGNPCGVVQVATFGLSGLHSLVVFHPVRNICMPCEKGSIEKKLLYGTHCIVFSSLQAPS